MRTALLLLLSTTLLADPSADVLKVFSTAAEALANDDAKAFLDQFDSNMPEYGAVRTNIEGLLAAYEVGSTIEVVSDEGSAEKRSVELDWLLLATQKDAVNGTQETRRRVIKCSVERIGKRWKITALAPIAFFSATATLP